MDNLNQVIGGNIQQLRQEMGVTQNQLEAILRSKGGAVSRWELGKNTPNAYYLLKLSKVFRCSIDRLFVGVSR